ncbi:unnamed protein product [Parnassius mnemosyne]|uniref:Uncharacterized protein n=1 Tax=Parnassius mnemosyne TaxID=213953 RepID=A0AAV1L5N7_9NEOP
MELEPDNAFANLLNSNSEDGLEFISVENILNKPVRKQCNKTHEDILENFKTFPVHMRIIMAPTKKSQEEIRRKNKECERRRREKIKSNPQLYEQAKAKERDRYRKRKEEKKIIPIAKRMA